MNSYFVLSFAVLRFSGPQMPLLPVEYLGSLSKLESGPHPQILFGVSTVMPRSPDSWQASRSFQAALSDFEPT